ncbi:MAG: hypothetical protein AAGA54_15315 [Myxococcota bacterium]
MAVPEIRWSALAISLALGLCGCDAEDAPPPAEPAAVPEAAASPAPPTASSPGVRGLDAALARGIEAPALDDATYRVDPFVAAIVFEEIRATEGAGVFTPVPASPPASAGYAVGPIEPDGVWGSLGLREGDVIEKLNGVPLTSADRLGPALDGAENRVTLTIFREDLSFTASYRFEGGLGWRAVLSNYSGETEPPDAAATAPEPQPEPQPEPEPETVPDASPAPAAPAPRRSKASSGRRSGGASAGRSPARPRPSGGAVRPAASKDIACSGSRCTITKRKFDDLRASPSRLQSGVDIVPAIRNDVHSGYKLKRVSSSSPIHAFGFRSGDKITHVNGRDLTDDAQAMALYWSLGSTRVFKVRFERGGRKQVKTISVV